MNVFNIHNGRVMTVERFRQHLADRKRQWADEINARAKQMGWDEQRHRKELLVALEDCEKLAYANWVLEDAQ